MINKNRYTVLFFLLVFLSPIVYQSVHVINHQYHLLFDDIHLYEASYDYTKYGNNDNDVIKLKDNHCFVCDYEFPIQIVPNVNSVLFKIPYFSWFFNENSGIKIFQEAFYLISPRAPPIS